MLGVHKILSASQSASQRRELEKTLELEWKYGQIYVHVLFLLCEKGEQMSPTVFRESGYRFFFFSREEDRMHVHVVSGDGEAKFWLEPEIELAKNYHYTRKQLKDVEKLIEEHQNELVSAWQEHFGN